MNFVNHFPRIAFHVYDTEYDHEYILPSIKLLIRSSKKVSRLGLS